MKCGKKDKEMLHAEMRSVFKLYSNHLNAQLSTQQMTGWDQQPVHFTTQLAHIYSPVLPFQDGRHRDGPEAALQLSAHSPAGSRDQCTRWEQNL